MRGYQGSHITKVSLSQTVSARFRSDYFRLIECCISEIVLPKTCVDPDFRGKFEFTQDITQILGMSLLLCCLLFSFCLKAVIDFLFIVKNFQLKTVKYKCV